MGRYPSRRDWKRYFKPLPLWVVILLAVLLYGRLVMVALWHWLLG
jgi:hypothetical protein